VGTPYDRNWQRARAAVSLLLVLSSGAASCGPTGRAENERISFTLSDSAGIVVAVSSGAGLHAPLGWEIASVPNLILGEDDSLILHLVQGLKPLPDGGVVLVNAGDQQLLFFDAHGQLVKRVGGNGAGPGEYRLPVLVPWTGTDSLLLFDKGQPRLQVLSADGAYQRTVPLTRWPAGRVPPLGALAADTLLFRSGRSLRQQRAMGTPADGLEQQMTEYFWHDPAAAQDVALDSVVSAFIYRTSGSAWGVPFRPRPTATAVKDGALITIGRTPEIRDYGRAGQLRRILRIDRPERRVTREMVAAYQPGLPRDVHVPATLPFFGATGVWANTREEGLVVDSEGWIWAQVYGWDPTQPKDWLLFDPEGKAHGVITTPRPLQILAIERDAIWGIWRDEWGVESVRKYGLQRRGSILSAATPDSVEH